MEVSELKLPNNINVGNNVKSVSEHCHEPQPEKVGEIIPC